MFYCEIIFSLLFITVQFIGINSENGFKKEILISCVSNKTAKEFNNFHLKYDPTMATHDFKFEDGEMDKLKELIGKNDKIIFFFVGHEDFLNKFAGRSFIIAKHEMISTKATTCTISYEYLCGPGICKQIQYFSAVENRVPNVVDMATSFIQNIVDSKEFKIKLASVYLNGYCLGGHIAGNVGHALKKIYNGQMVSAIWAYDPPRFAFPHPSVEGEPRRVQKGDGKFVVVFHSSQIGVQDNIADVDVILNGAKNQPGLNKPKIGVLFDHFAAFLLREFIILRSKEIEKNERGFPFAVKLNQSDQFSLELTNPPSNKSGEYHINTGAIFDFK
ncbi:uncharacterized protein LOC116344144 [Contarinia nasturtii]|uniref:uncharacterized protein LOC116344144 n=1 Tax=Contarinia nasturtii TaxID=265458 RepID=UPI0012D495B2|nr:uncharacterized protein LOC116344144 [Contarinia nasturtii]